MKTRVLSGDALLSWCVTRKQAPAAPVSSEPCRDARYRTAVRPKLGRKYFARSSNQPAGTRNRHCATRLSKTDTRTCGRLTWHATSGFTFHDARPTSARVSRIPLGVVFRSGTRDSLTSDVPVSVPRAPVASFETCRRARRKNYEPLPRQRVNAAGLRDPGTPDIEEQPAHARVNLPLFDFCNRPPSPSTFTNERLPAPSLLFTPKVALPRAGEMRRFPDSCSKHQHSDRFGKRPSARRMPLPTHLRPRHLLSRDRPRRTGVRPGSSSPARGSPSAPPRERTEPETNRDAFLRERAPTRRWPEPSYGNREAPFTFAARLFRPGKAVP